MPKWIVKGADKQTGEPRTLKVTAPDQEAATEKAMIHGLLVSSAEPWTDVHQVALKSKSTSHGATINSSSRANGLRTLGVLVWIVSAVLFVVPHVDTDQISTGFSNRPGERFASDNAIGATANAIEVMVWRQSWYQFSATGFIIGAVFITGGVIVRSVDDHH